MNADITVTVIITQNPPCLTLDREDFAKKNLRLSPDNRKHM